MTPCQKAGFGTSVRGLDPIPMLTIQSMTLVGEIEKSCTICIEGFFCSRNRHRGKFRQIATTSDLNSLTLQLWLLPPPRSYSCPTLCCRSKFENVEWCQRRLLELHKYVL